MKFKIKLEVSATEETETVSLNELGYTEKEWSKMADDEKRRALVYYIENVNQPYWLISEIEEI